MASEAGCGCAGGDDGLADLHGGRPAAHVRRPRPVVQYRLDRRSHGVVRLGMAKEVEHPCRRPDLPDGLRDPLAGDVGPAGGRGFLDGGSARP
jgi:hypothetical protein